MEMEVGDPDASPLTSYSNEKYRSEVTKLAKANLDLLRAGTVGEDSDDDSQYETAEDSESDLEVRYEIETKSGPTSVPSHRMNGNEEKEDQVSKVKWETPVVNMENPVNPDLASLTILLKEKDEEIDRLTSVNKDLLREVQRQKEKTTNLQQKIINLVAISSEDNEDSEKATPNKHKRKKRVKTCIYEYEEIGSCR